MKKLVALILLAAGVARADGLEKIPKWHMLGDEACYGFQDAKKLVLLDKELVLCDTTKQTVVDLKLRVGDLDKALTKEKEALVLEQKGHNGTKADYLACIDEKTKWEVKADRGPSVAWLIAGGVTLLLAGWVAGAYLIH